MNFEKYFDSIFGVFNKTEVFLQNIFTKLQFDLFFFPPTLYMRRSCDHRITESPRLEKTSKIIQPNHPPTTSISPLNHVP